MNKTVLWTLLLLAGTALILIIIFHNRTPFGKDNSSFATETEKGITRIEFSEGDRRLFLEKKGENWLINGKNEARRNSILFILRVLKEIKIKSPVSPELFETEIVQKKSIPVKVKVYENRKLLKTYLVYKTRSNLYGDIMKMKDGTKPFIVYIPGYEGEIGSAFTTNELFWQSYTLFNLMPSEIASVRLENFADTASSFSIINNKHHFFLSGLNGELKGWDSTLVARYLSYFTWIPFESWNLEMGDEQKKVTGSESPLYKLTLSTTNGKTTILTLWERLSGEGDKKTKDTDRLIGKTQQYDEFFIMRYFDIDPILKKRSYFFPR
jgi:hypothetical protein